MVGVDGTVSTTVQIPADTLVGERKLVATDEDGMLLAAAPLQVTAPAVVPISGEAPAGSGELAATGGGLPASTALLALLLLACGGLLLRRKPVTS